MRFDSSGAFNEAIIDNTDAARAHFDSCDAFDKAAVDDATRDCVFL